MIGVYNMNMHEIVSISLLILCRDWIGDFEVQRHNRVVKLLDDTLRLSVGRTGRYLGVKCGFVALLACTLFVHSDELELIRARRVQAICSCLRCAFSRGQFTRVVPFIHDLLEAKSEMVEVATAGRCVSC